MLNILRLKNFNTLRFPFAAIVFSLFFVGCQTTALDVHYDMENVDFKQYQQVKVETLNDPNNRIISLITNAIESQMLAKGYSLSETPDLVLVYEVHLDQGQRLKQEQIPVKGMIYTLPKLEAVNKASILINAFDPDVDRVVWKASSSREITKVSPDKIKQERINSAITELLNSLPSK